MQQVFSLLTVNRIFGAVLCECDPVALDFVTITLPDIQQVPEANENIIVDIINRSLQTLLDEYRMLMLRKLDMCRMMAALAVSAYITKFAPMSRHRVSDKLQHSPNGLCGTAR
jgi:hypothetical protein